MQKIFSLNYKKYWHQRTLLFRLSLLSGEFFSSTLHMSPLVYPYLLPLHPLRTHQTNSEILCLSQAAVIITVIQVLSTIHAHKNTVMDCQWNKNGNWLLTASRDHLLKLFDIRYDEGHFALGLYSEIFKP